MLKVMRKTPKSVEHPQECPLPHCQEIFITNSEQEVENYLEPPQQLSLSIKPFSMNETKTMIDSLKVTKIIYDLITGRILNYPRKSC